MNLILLFFKLPQSLVSGNTGIFVINMIGAAATLRVIYQVWRYLSNTKRRTKYLLESVIVLSFIPWLLIVKNNALAIVLSTACASIAAILLEIEMHQLGDMSVLPFVRCSIRNHDTEKTYRKLCEIAPDVKWFVETESGEFMSDEAEFLKVFDRLSEEDPEFRVAGLVGIESDRVEFGELMRESELFITGRDSRMKVWIPWDTEGGYAVLYGTEGELMDRIATGFGSKTTKISTKELGRMLIGKRLDHELD